MTRCRLVEAQENQPAFYVPLLLLEVAQDIVKLVHQSYDLTLKEWDKYRVAFVLQGKPHYVEEDDKVINTKVCIKSTIF